MARPSAARSIRTSLVPHLGLALVGLLFLLPFVWLVLTSVKSEEEIFSLPVVWWPSTFEWLNYSNAVQAIPFLRYTLNTLFLCALAVIGQLISAPLAAYGFSRLQFRGRNLMFFIMMGSMMLPYQVTMIPVYVLFNKLNMVDTYWPIILQNLFGIPFYIFLMRQFFLTIPYELTESAKIDGASEFRIYWQIIMPLAKPALYSVALFAFLNEWKDFLGPLIYLNDPDKWTLSVGLRAFIGEHKVSWGLLMASATMFTVPIVVLYFFVQKKFIQGISLTGLK
ncbi:Inner membrane ABC transporter permease protein ycjP [Chlamydia abortus]|jgi:multiple sugar transport system permease protein|uniref:Carbohydrate ABC transporter permease n=1 Tax=Paenibacillus residui TaxID=629724 RepID=A0ABW3D7M4_9BACL|nr:MULTISPECIES: carbohydrate ABC transporter permease [Paenibacillaceae]SHE13401.1 Inner membrane ABC transporter permease protein ycjP [Chlamydia abortus]